MTHAPHNFTLQASDGEAAMITGLKDSTCGCQHPKIVGSRFPRKAGLGDRVGPNEHQFRCH